MTTGVGASSRGNRFSAVMEQHLTVVHESAQECMCACPFCGGKSSLGFNDEKGLWICFKCGEKGSAQTLVEKLDGIYTEPEVELGRLSAELRSLEFDVQQSQSRLPDSYLLRFRQAGRVHEHWRSRGFDADVCSRWELGYDFLTDRMSLPFRDPFTGGLGGIIFRALSGEGPRYQYPKGFARRESLYGSWFLPDVADRHVVLAEGPTDAIRISQRGVSAVAQYGSSIAAGQIRLLHRLGIQVITPFYDYDRAGLSAVRQAQELLGGFFLLEHVAWDREKYCWHRKVCECSNRQHQILNWGMCPHKRLCTCRRIHEPDPGGLSLKEIDRMLGRLGRKERA
jgi:DNA primase